MIFQILHTVRGGGYHYVLTYPPHPRRNPRGYYPRHIVVAENKIGRLLVPGEEVHHIDEDKNNDRPENLEVKTKPAHARDHMIKRIYGT